MLVASGDVGMFFAKEFLDKWEPAVAARCPRCPRQRALFE